MPSFVDLHFGGFLFSVLTLPGPHATPPPPMSAPTYSDLLRLIITGIQRYISRTQASFRWKKAEVKLISDMQGK